MSTKANAKTPAASGRKGRSSSGRAQPKGTAASSGKGGKARRSGRQAVASTTSERYTPPQPKSAKKSPPWMGALIIALFTLGVLLIILNYVNALPGGVSNWWLVGAIGLVFAGLMAATKYH
ncbi:MAG: cell division protein CrgA [Acidimicrobiales bacterium]